MSDDLKEAIENLAPLIGKFAILFSIAEQEVDNCVLFIHQTFPSARQQSRRIPRPLKDKLKFLDHCVEEIPELAEYRDDGHLISRQMTELSRHRNFLIHGAPTIKGHESHSLKLKKISYEPATHRYEDRIYSWRDIKELVHKADIVCVNILCVTAMLKHEMTKRLRKGKRRS